VLSSDELKRLAAQQTTVLKREQATTVEVLGAEDDAVVRKVYRNLGTRWLQSFARRSRAQREYDNLRAVERTGSSCTQALAWSAKRRLLCIDESTLVTRFLPASPPLKKVLAELPREGSAATRRHLAEAMGQLLATLHRGGFLWCTPMPRNVLVVGAPERGELAVCDTPAGIDFGRSIHGTPLCTIDLFDAAFSPSRRRDFSSPERFRWLLAYCAGDREAARRLWRKVAPRSVFAHDARRALAMFWHTYILLPLRLRRSNQQQSAT
jgi:tRNA A-37 threonylcarbamoyl transferase component Bud32